MSKQATRRQGHIRNNLRLAAAQAEDAEARITAAMAALMTPAERQALFDVLEMHISRVECTASPAVLETLRDSSGHVFLENLRSAVSFCKGVVCTPKS